MAKNETYTYLVQNIFDSISRNDLKTAIKNTQVRIIESTQRLSEDFTKPSLFVKSDYNQTNELINSIINLAPENNSEQWIKTVFTLDDIFSKTDLSVLTDLLEEEATVFLEAENCNKVIKTAIDTKDKFKQDYSEILQNIQYHDIIRQKLEHISEFNKGILEEIHLSENKNRANRDVLKYLPSLDRIIDIQIAQLKYIIEQYRTSITKIIHAFTEQYNLIFEGKTLIEVLQKRTSIILDKVEKHSQKIISFVNRESKLQPGKQLEESILFIAQNKDTISSQISTFIPSQAKHNKLLEIYKHNIDDLQGILNSNNGFLYVINDIIRNLNNIYNKIISQKGGDPNKFTNDNLEFLKEKYTMESEYKIHELVLSKDKSITEFSKFEEQGKNEDIEFF